MNLSDLKVSDLNNDYSGMKLVAPLRKLGYTQHEIVEFGDHKYIVMSHRAPRPGVNRMDVIDITKFNTDNKFKIAEDRGSAYLRFEDEGMSVLTVLDGEVFDDWASPLTAVLQFRVVPATTKDNELLSDDLDAQLQENGLRHR